MRRRTTLVLGVVVIVFLAGVMVMTMGSTITKVTPAEIQTGEYDGEHVTVEGQVASRVHMGETIRFEIVGNQTVTRENASLETAPGVQVVYTGDNVPATLEKGRVVIVSGEVRDGVLYTGSPPKVRAHLNEEKQ
ncbi:MAG: cytochrome c maturation protein CcmE [Halodesulfurarchaeum sp.]